MFCDENVFVVCMVIDKLTCVVFGVKNVQKMLRGKNTCSKKDTKLKNEANVL